MAKLSEQDKTWIVVLLARFEPPAAVVVRMREDCGVITDRFQVRTYDPRSARYEAGERWRELFWRERERHLNEIADIPIAHKAYRLNMLQNLLDRSMRDGNTKAALATLRQAAEEAGDSLTSERQAKVSDPGDAMSSEERQTQFEELIRGVLESKPPLLPALPRSTGVRETAG